MPREKVIVASVALTIPHSLITLIANASVFPKACTANFNRFLAVAEVGRVLSGLPSSEDVNITTHYFM